MKKTLLDKIGAFAIGTAFLLNPQTGGAINLVDEARGKNNLKKMLEYGPISLRILFSDKPYVVVNLPEKLERTFANVERNLKPQYSSEHKYYFCKNRENFKEITGNIKNAYILVVNPENFDYIGLYGEKCVNLIK